ncbi:methyl-accepting chemotaxis protein [Desulfosarcina ovata]|uniref:Methyl-accepting chemotaxis sensory transducer n=1 Tax=Desulfosarcina ovata subsp. ovata TaxID=2752305 RepID=A0A5K8AIE9_9BACT|nr:methyl-accepting chemotaxis protein [Desulfosarcina ovata]BBO91660.1 methyl-accepting chemotaxis sensory transducer [Desulfosarcina ovata subsp. ovata]
MKMNLHSIASRLIIGGLSAVLIPLIIVGYLSFSKSHSALSDLAAEQVQGVTSDLARMTENTLQAEMDKTTTMASQKRIIALAETVKQSGVEAAGAQVDDVFHALKTQFNRMSNRSHYQGVFIADTKGDIYTGVLSNGQPYKKINIANDSVFQRVQQTKAPAISEMILSRATGKPIVATGAPIFSKSNELLGVMGLVINADYFSDVIVNRKIGNTGYGVLLSSDGTVLAHPNHDLVLKLNTSTIKEMASLNRRTMAGETGVERFVLKGVAKVAGFAPVGINGWAINVSQEEAEFMAASHSIRNWNILVAVIAGALMTVVILMVSRSIVNPINSAVAGLKDIAQGEGDLTMRLEATSKDEVGDLARWFNTFIEKLQGIIKDIAGGVETLSSSSTELSAISEQMTQGIETVTEKSNTVSAAAEEMSTNTNNVAAAMEQSATNTNMVATAAEEMSATIDEIAKNAEKARGISDEAAHKASSASTNMDQLGAAANDIGKVIETITDISEQVNLLALNATIEAARAGEAGKGFAVVANEIKELAKQTAEATGDIKEKIESIQGTTNMTVGQIGEITQVITDVNDVVATIATAVEEQSAATKDIATNVAQASQGIQEVNENVNQSSSVSAEISQDIAGVSVSMNEMSTSSNQVNLSAQELSKLSESLKQMVDQFKV